MKPCGTEAAYKRHQRKREKPCQDCVVGLAEARIARGITQTRQRQAQHGTNYSYVKGCRCDECREARNAYLRDLRATKRRHSTRGRIRDIIIDYLMTEDRPMSRGALVDLIRDRHPDLLAKSIATTLFRMSNDGLVESVPVEEEWDVVWRLTDDADGWFDE